MAFCRRSSRVALVGIALFMALPSVLILGFGQWVTLTCRRSPTTPITCNVDRRQAWGLWPQGTYSLQDLHHATVDDPDCTAEACVYRLRLYGQSQSVVVFRFQAQEPALGAVATIDQFVANPTQLSFEQRYHEPFYVLGLAIAALGVAGGIGILGLRSG